MSSPRRTFERELQLLQDQILVMGSMVEEAMMTAIDQLKKRDLAGAQRLIERDVEINTKRYAIEGQTLALIALHQPVARDLRTLAAILEIATELERIGDYAKGIAKINLLIGDKPLLKPLIDIPLMAEKALDMLRRALDAFVQQDVEAARVIPADDDEVDHLYEQVYRELMTYILADPSTIEQANHLLWAAHNLERAADRVSNICERILFTVTGELSEFDSQVKIRKFDS
ncbi:MAG TPA: phosphate signaling complex protein PhoU [Anaerolineae bacterium]|nr:phosphate signaling complex protein PhoU [Anaerolineae bacterium]HQI83992.1 phosphate signaling complex protein PhoU [Anaerolineae bacterium]